MECPRCHTANENDATACINCGLRLTKTDSHSARIDQVKIVNIDMPFMSMVYFLVKLTLAAIPAAIIATVIVLAFGGLLASMFHIFR